jgi:hypothetical protein
MLNSIKTCEIDMPEPTSEVQRITVTIKPAKPGFSGQVCYGYYVLRDRTVTLTDPNGNPAEDGIGKRYTHKLETNEDAFGVARRLTKQLRSALRGNSAGPSNFNDKIVYPRGWQKV